MEQKANLNIKILPFGHISIEMKGSESAKENKLDQSVIYGEPGTSYPPLVEISFGGEEYRTPKTTGGTF